MANYSELTTLINAYVYANGVQAITGSILNGVLLEMVDQLGRGYTLMGTAVSTDDPGTPDGPEAYLASEGGTYTNFGGLEVADGELALLSYDSGWTKVTLFDGIQEVDATIDSDYGTPSVTASYADGVLSFAFSKLHGIGVASVEQTTTSTESGGTNVITVTLDDGTSSTFQVVNGVGIASVEQTTSSSDPSGVNVVTVTLTNGQTETFQVENGVGIVSIEQTTTSTESGGTNIFTVSMSDGQTYDFQVENGAQGVSVSSVEQTTTSTESGGTNVVTVTLSDGTTSTFQVMNGAKGDQGNSGYTGAADELEVVNNLTDGGSTAALSAEMGVQLESEISQLSLELANLSGKYYGLYASASDLPEDATNVGYAFVGASEPFAIYNWDGTTWTDSGATVSGITGEPGVGFASVTSNQDGTLTITLTSGDTITVDLNHDHTAYPKYVLCADEAEYTAITTKESDTLYLIPEE